MQTRMPASFNSKIAKAAVFLGLKRNLVGLLFMVVLVGLGENMAEQYLPLYIMALGGGFLSVGLLNGMDNLLSALYSFPGGYLSDRLGSKRALLVFNLVSILGYLIVIVFPYWWAVIIGAAFFLSWSAISLPATMSLVASSLPKDKRTMGVSMHSLVRRIPMALGPLLGAAFVGTMGVENGVRWAFVVASFLAVVSIFLQQYFIQEHTIQVKSSYNPIVLFKEMSPGLKQLLMSDILVRFCEQIPYAFVVIWAIGTAGAPGFINAYQFGILRVLEMAVAVLIYIPVAYLADKTQKKPYVVITFVFFTLFPLMLLFSRSFWMLALAFIVRGLKEFGEPTRKALIMDLAAEGKKASSFGLYYLVRDVIVSIAAFFGAYLWAQSPTTNLLTAFGFGLLGTIYFALFGKSSESVHA